ncbi:DNA double-strand break repair nuclease NurA [Sulfurihydrogenibium sp.]|uniref:DNA double-strand break repair nuclease NurA n=1 Tax=Sulfurihydrogenibium sp. TaxID=2053621 RepID=UPI0026198355|nr:DNA double-strand break repair nuclease NurA [Sulfurihydrogenibium sp.]
MLYQLLEIVRERKEEIRSYLESKDDNVSVDKVLENWTNYTPQHKDAHVCSSDGSFYSKQYLGFFLGVFSGYAESFNPSNLEKDEAFVGDIYISVIKQSDNFKTLLTLFMFLSEIKAAYNLAKEKNPDVILLDGTLTSKFIIPFPLPYWFTKEIEEEKIFDVVSKVYEKLKKECLSYPSIYSLSKDISKLVLENLPEKRRDLFEVVISQLAYYEHLITFYNLLNLDYKPIILGIAKTSTGNDILKYPVPDIKLFLTYCKELGYSKSVPQNLQNLKSEFGKLKDIDPQLNNNLYDLMIESFYGKYSDVRAINLIEYYQNPDKPTIKKEEILDYLANTTAAGYNYPFILKRVDNQVRITASDFEIIERELGFWNFTTGREAL